MTTEKHVKLFEQLYARTKRGDLAWTTTPEPGSYMVSFKNHSVELDRQDPESMTPVVSLYIRNSSGDVIESIGDTTLGSEMPAEQRKNFYDHTEELYRMARSIALGTDKAIEDILGELEDPF